VISLEGKVVVVTGSARGQGAREASLCAELGAKVVVCDVLDVEGEEIAAELAGRGLTAFYQHLDVSDESSWNDLVERVRHEHGRLDGLVNNAGVALRSKSFVETTLDDWHRVLSINLTGPFLGMRASAPLMRDGGGGSIVNTCSVAALTGYMGAAYSASKWGLRGLAKNAALELCDFKVRVNSIHPGVIVTPIVEGAETALHAVAGMTPLGRPGSVDDVAPLVAFLLSDASSYISGVDIPVDGGFTQFGLYTEVLRKVMAAGGRASMAVGESRGASEL
jgi:3alpha(or 20beta)-hydroxysteroid dehydrogenase